MSARLDRAVQQFPDHEEGVRLLAARDPSGNLKYLDWGARVLASKQALAPEVADVVDLFHQFRGRWFGAGHRRRERVRPDIYSYRPQDLARLRDGLLKIKRAADKKRRARERLYRIDGALEADVVYDSPDLVVRHVKNKQASVHYGLNTKWCISMQRDGYFDEYASRNATFFFFERKSPAGDEFDKVAVMVPRGGDGATAEAFTATDRRVDMMALARVYGARVFDVFRAIHEASERWPGSAAFLVGTGAATREQLEATFASLAGSKALSPHETDALLEAICCNDDAPPSLLEEVVGKAESLSTAAWRRLRGRGCRPSATRVSARVRELVRRVAAAVAIHPRTPDELRDRLTRQLRRGRVDVSKIRRVTQEDGVGVVYRDNQGYRRLRHRTVRRTPSGLRSMADRLERRAAKARAQAARLETAAKKKKKEKALARRSPRR